DVVAVGHRLQVADRRQCDERRLLALEALDARPRARRPVAQLEARLREAGVADDAVLAEVLEDARCGVLRHPRVVHDVDVELAGLALAVLEGLGEPGVIRLGQQLDRDPGLLLEERDDLLPDGDRPVRERADYELPGVGGSSAACSGERRGRAEQRRGGEPGATGRGTQQQVATAERPVPAGGGVLGRHLGCHSDISLRLLARSLRWSAVVPSGPKKHALFRATRTPIGQPIGAVNSRAARAMTRWSPMRTSTRVSLPIGSTT